jgi:hypothetical protein
LLLLLFSIFLFLKEKGKFGGKLKMGYDKDDKR